MPIAIPTLDAAGQAGPSGSEKVKADYWDSVISQPAEWGFAAHTAELENLQRGLVDDVEELIAQEGYDVAVQAGLREWVADRGMVHRALRRHRYDLAKTHAALLHTIAYRITHSLHLPIPPYPSSFSTDASHHHLPSSSTSLAPSHPDPASADVQDIPAYTILPVPTFHTRSNQPIALITLQHVQRDDDGSLDGLKEWVRWGMEMTRRALRDWDACRGAVGRGGLIGHFGSDGVSGMKGGEPEGHVRRPDGDGEGLKATSADKNEGGDEGVGRCVLVVDAAGAGYRNLEVEILPTLLSTAQTHFPALYSSVLIVNAGWAQRSMWSVVRRLLPRSAAERVRFLDVGDGGALGEWFNSDALPVSLGGTVPYALSSTTDHTQLRYAHHASYHPTPYPLPPSSALDRQSVSGSGSATSCLAQNASTPPIFRCGTTPHVPPNSQEGGGNGDEGIWRTVSCSSISDLFYTAPGSPVVSVQGSRRNSLGRGTGLGDGDVVDAAAAEGGATPRAGELSGLGGVRGSALSRKLQHLHGLQMTRTRSDPNANSSRPYRDSEEPSEMDSNQSQQIQADSQQTGSPLTAVPLATPTRVETGLVPTDEMGGGELRRRRSYGSIHRARDPMGVTDKYGHGYEHEHSQDRAGRAEGQGQASPVLASSSFVAGLDQLVPRSSLSSAHSGPGVFKPLPAIATVKGKSNSRLASLARLMPLSTTNAPGSKPTSPNMSPIQRIKSLSDFHLYLSPSRLANIDLLSDSESESDPDEGNGRVRDDVMVARCPRSGRAGLGNAAGALDDVETKYPTARRTPSGGMDVETSGIASIPPASDTPVRSPNHPRRPALASTPTRRTLHPLILDPTETDRLHASLSLAHRRARPGLRIHGVESDLSQPGSRLTGGEQMSGGMPGGGARTYSGQMGLHHVAVLRTYQRGSPLRGVWGGAEQILGGHGGSGTGGIVDAGPGTSTSPPDDSGTYPNAPSNPDLSGCDTNTTQSTPNPAPSNIDQTHAISAYSRSLNPWYGYPALLTRTPTGSVSLVPRYARRRHRDLFKTLLFLAMLRLQNIRDSAERMLGLRALGGVPWGRLRGRYLDRDWAFGFAGAKVDESVRTASTGIGGSGQEGGDGERGRSNRVRDTGEGEVVGPAEGLERVEREQHRRRLLSGISIDPASGHSQYETRPAYTQPGQGSRVERNLATAPADKYLRLARYLVLSLLPASTYSAEWVWAIVGLVLFRGAWVRVMYRVLGAVGWLRVMVGMGVHKVGFGGR